MLSILQYVIDKESDYTPISDIDDERFRLIVQDYFLWLANYLSQYDILDKVDVLSELDGLGLTEVIDP